LEWTRHEFSEQLSYYRGRVMQPQAPQFIKTLTSDLYFSRRSRFEIGWPWLILIPISLALTNCSPAYSERRVGYGPEQLRAEADCRQGKATGCSQIGRFLLARSENDTDNSKDQQRGLVFLEMACGQDDLAACTALGRFYLEQPKYGKSLARARTLLALSCDRQWAEACTSMGEVVWAEDRKDRQGILAFFRKGCELGDGRGCELVAKAQMADGFSGNPSQAKEALAKACATDRLSSCHLLAQTLVRDPETRKEGVGLFVKNCVRGFPGSCTQAAAFFAPLLSAYPDCNRAIPPADAACKAKDDDGCALAAFCRAQLQGAISLAAVEQLERLCDRSSALGCLYWADQQTGRGAMAADPGRVRGAYQTACRGHLIGSGIGCVRIQLMNLEEAKTSQGAESVISNLREACKESFAEACCKLAELYQKGQWVTADEAQSAEFQAKACQAKPCCARKNSDSAKP
jgi:TPR repeat protein